MTPLSPEDEAWIEAIAARTVKTWWWTWERARKEAREQVTAYYVDKDARERKSEAELLRLRLEYEKETRDRVANYKQELKEVRDRNGVRLFRKWAKGRIEKRAAYWAGLVPEKIANKQAEWELARAVARVPGPTASRVAALGLKPYCVNQHVHGARIVAEGESPVGLYLAAPVARVSGYVNLGG